MNPSSLPSPVRSSAAPPPDLRAWVALRPPTSVPARPRGGPATYSELTRGGATALAEALVSCDAQAWTLANLRESAGAHRHLTARLVLLGRALTTPLSADHPHLAAAAPSRRATADTRLLRRLEASAQPRDWSAPSPAAGTPAGSMHRAADLVGAAAELWATHHDAAGSARGPEASRLRHPATLGAATREWRELVLVAGAVADGLVRAATSLLPADGDRARLLVGLASYPQPAWRRDRVPREPVPLTVSRPRSTSVDDLQATRERVRHLRHVAWRLSRAGIAPVPVIVNLAAIGALLHEAATDAALTRRRGPGARQRSSRTGAPATTPARPGAEAWREVYRAVEHLRSLHPPQTAVQVERLDLQRLIERVLSAAHDGAAGAAGAAEDTARSLAELASEFDLVAPDLLRAVRAAAGRNEFYVRGRAVTNDLLPRRPELIEARLRDGIAPAPSALVRRLEAALADVGRPGHEQAGDAPPAA